MADAVAPAPEHVSLLRESWHEIIGMGVSFAHALPKLVVAAIVLVAVVWAGRGVGSLVRSAFARFSEHPYVSVIVGRMARIVVAVLGTLVAISIAFPSFTPANLIQVLGIGSVAVGFAFKDIFQNFLAGILILLTRPFRIGDQVQYDRYEGTVEDIQTRATLIATYDGLRVVVPNGNVFTNIVVVRTAYPRRRLQVSLPVYAGQDLDELKRRARETVAGVEGVLADPGPEPLLVQLDDGAIRLRVRWWIQTPIQTGAKVETDRVLSALAKALGGLPGLPLPPPPAPVKA
jgi:small-conductance mechanosensitive channel